MAENEPTQTKPGLLPPAYFFFCLVVGIGLHFVFPIYQLIPWPYQLAGVILLVVGGQITGQAERIFKQRGTTVKPHLEPSVLVTTGPFRISRHPMYLGMTLILLGVAVLCGSVSPLVTPIVFAVLMQVKFMPHEERAMMRIFGEQYAAYKTRVRAWL